MNREPNQPINQAFDVCVVGATPGGIAAAIRIARNGHQVLLTQHNHHIGGMCTNGLGQWDALSDHKRCPIFKEILDRLEEHYRETYGVDSDEHRAATYNVANYPPGCYEPSVIEGIFKDMLKAEHRATLRLGVYPKSATVQGGTITEIVLQEANGNGLHAVRAKIFIDASYEGDLAALAGVPYRVGREGKEEYGEPHAGLLYTLDIRGRAPEMAVEGRLNFHPYESVMGRIDPSSPQTSDARIQAYNMRLCVSRNPANRIYPERPPESYDRREYVHYGRKSLAIHADIHGKNSYNSAILPGENWAYPEADWAQRELITKRHLDFALGLMWFLHNDSAIAPERREHFRTWGLPPDEYTDNGNVPYEMYVRESRRIVGRHVLNENDMLPRDGFTRPRTFEDSISFNDWYMDSHSCSRDLGTYGEGSDLTGSELYPFDGRLVLTKELRPGMIPYRSLVSKEVSNLLVPVCASTTHIAWGTMRLEPIWIHLGEVAGFAACQSLATGESVSTLNVSSLQRSLLEAGASIAFFNQHRTASDRSEHVDRQLAACHGEWDSYDFDVR